MSDASNMTLSDTGPMSPRYAKAIVSFTTAVIHTRSVEEVLWLLTDDVVMDLGFEDCVVYLVDEERNTLVQKAAFGNKKAGPAQILDPIEVELGQGITGRCASEQRPILVNDLSEDPSYLVDDLQRLSELAVPILSEGKTIGVIDSEHSQKDFYTNQHLVTLRALSAIITTKYENECAIRDLKASEARLRHLANHDSLSGLPNRNCFVSELTHAAERYAEGELTKLAVLIMDLDRFKLVNDSYGHSAGDALIVRVGELLRQALPEALLFARLSGDEFALLIKDYAEGEPQKLCELILESLAQPISLPVADVRVSASIGVAEASSETCTSGSLMKLADGAMYKSKAQGKGCYTFSQSGVEVEALSDLNLERAIADALHAREFQVFLQPIVDLNTQRPVAFESLIRWQHPRIGMIRPDYFIEFAERSGQIRDIDLYMIESVGRILDAISSKLGQVVPISVNVSASLLSRDDWIERIDRGLFSRGMRIEVTERALIADVSIAAETLNTLRGLGAHIYIDDFGTGYSSLSYLHRLPLDAIKIDRSFVDSLVDEEKSKSLVRALVALGQGMQCELVAEGVETEGQLKALQALQVTRGQGYLFARPVPADKVSEYLRLYQP